MKLAVVAYPNLEPADREWIEAVRIEHDPQATRLGSHFTLVFPFEGEPAPVGEEIAVAARMTSQIAFEIGSAKVVSDTLTPQIHIFLVPSRGAEEICALHERLYSNSLRQLKRQDIPYVPHLTVAGLSTVQSAENLARSLGMHGADRRVVQGIISAIAW